LVTNNYVKKEVLEIEEKKERKSIRVETDTYVGTSTLLYHHNYTDIPFVTEEDIENY